MNAMTKTARRAARVVSAPVEPANPFTGLSDMPELENAAFNATNAARDAERTFNTLGPQLRAELRALKANEGEWLSDKDMGANPVQKKAQSAIAKNFKIACLTARAIAAEPLFAEAENPIAFARAFVVQMLGEKNNSTRPSWWEKADQNARAMLSRALFAEGLRTVEARGGNRKADEAPKAEAPKAEAPKAEAPKADEAPKAEAPKAEAPAFERIEAVDIIAAATATFGPSCTAFLAKLEESGAKPDAKSKPIVSAIKSLALLLQKANEAK